MNKARTSARVGVRPNKRTAQTPKKKRRLSIPAWATSSKAFLMREGGEFYRKAVKGTKNEFSRQYEGLRDRIEEGKQILSWAPYGLALGLAHRSGLAQKAKKHYDNFKKWNPGGMKDWEKWHQRIIGLSEGLGVPSNTAAPRVSLLDNECGPTFTNTPGAMGVAGELYSDRWHMNDGGSNKQLQLAKNLYKLRTRPIYDSDYSKNVDGGTGYFASQFSQCGINRRGWYLPWPDSSSARNYVSLDANSDQVVYDSAGTLQARHLYKFWADNISTDVFKYMSGYNTGNVELYLPLQSTWSTHQIQNRLTQSSVKVSAYLIRCKDRWYGHPLRSVYDWAVDPVSSGTQVEVNCAPSLSPEGKSYYYQRVPRTAKVGTPGQVAGSQEWDAETATRPAVTPSFSNNFKKHFEIVDVMHKEIEPNDTWELTFKRTFNRPLKWSQFKAFYGEVAPFSNETTMDYIQPGDYDVVFSYVGGPGSCSGFGMGKITGTALEDVENLNPITVENHRCRISKTVKHSLSVAWPNVETKGDTAATPDEFENNGFITVTERLPDALQHTASFDRELTLSGKDYLIPNWPAIGTAESSPVLGTTDNRVEGTIADLLKEGS